MSTAFFTETASFFRRDSALAAVSGWRQVGDFGDLTASDPNGLVTGYAYASGTHTLTLATLGVSNVDYNFGSGSNFTGARWTFPLTYSDGSPVQAGDAFVLRWKVTNISVGAARTWNVGLAAVVNASSTVLNTMDAMGATVGMSGVGTPLCGTWRRNTVGTSSMANGVTMYSDALFGGLPTKIKAGVTSILSSNSNAATTQGIDGNALSVADNTQMQAIIAVGSLGTATTTGGDFAFKLFYAVDKLS